MTLHDLATRLDRIEAMLAQVLEPDNNGKQRPTASAADLLRAKEFASMGLQRTKEHFNLLAKKQKEQRKRRATK